MSEHTQAGVDPGGRGTGARTTLALFAVVFLFLAAVVGSTLLGGGGDQPQTHTMQDGSVMTGDMQAPDGAGR